MSTIGTIELLATIDTSQYKKGTKEIQSANRDVEDSADSSSKKAASSWSTGAQLATAAIVAAGAIIVKTFVSSASEIQSLRASFESLTGNVEDTNSVMTDLYELGKKTAFSNKDIQAAGRNYLAAGVSVEGLGEVLKNTADIAGATGADLGQLTLPLTQTIARGKLQTQDFYQILNSGAGALRKPLTELAGKKGFGSLAEALEKSGITSDDLLKVMGDVTKEGGFAFQGAIKQSETFNGRMSNLREAITNVGLGLLGVDAVTGEIDPSGPFAKMSSAIAKATEFLTNNGEQIKQVGTVISILLLPAIIALGVQSLLAGARIAAGMLLALGPIGLIVAAVAAATYLIISNWDTVKSFVVGVWDSVKDAVASAFNWIKDNWPLLLAILTGPIGLAILAIVKNFDRIKEIAGTVIGWFKDIGSAIGNALGNAFKTAVNAVLGFLESRINDIVDVMNNAIHLIDNITPGGLARIGKVALPRLAEGGIVTRPTVAEIGEGGEAEAVIPLSKLDKMLAGNPSSGSSSNVTINLSGVMASSRADLRAVAKELSNALQEEMNAKGFNGNVRMA